MQYPVDALKPFVAEGQTTATVFGDSRYFGTSRHLVFDDGRTVPTLEADRLAVHVGLHPSLIWPSWFDDAADEPHCRYCGEVAPFVPSNVVWCSLSCKEAARGRYWRWEARKHRSLWERVDRVTERVAAMSEDELREFLGCR
jgi:hypothetical protein